MSIKIIDLKRSVLQQIQDSLLTDQGVTLYLKRDDLLHSEISGNKWRKLEYNLQAFEISGKKRMVTFGGVHSNHLAAVAALGKLWGIPTVGIVRGKEHQKANWTLDQARKNGMEIHPVTREEYRKRYSENWLSAMKANYSDCYFIPEGGANEAGVKGCEAIPGEIDEAFTHIAVPCGTGTTLAGIARGLPKKTKAIGFPVLKGGEGLKEEVGKWVSSNSNWELDPEFHFGGFARIQSALVEFIQDFYRDHQVRLDPVYTGKMMYGLFQRIREGAFSRGAVIVAVHTGGLQGVKGMEGRYGVTFFGND